MYVADQIYDRFMQRSCPGRDDHAQLLDSTRDVGSLVSEAQLETVTRHVDDAGAKGATVLAGGRARPDIGPCSTNPPCSPG